MKILEEMARADQWFKVLIRIHDKNKLHGISITEEYYNNQGFKFWKLLKRINI